MGMGTREHCHSFPIFPFLTLHETSNWSWRTWLLNKRFITLVALILPLLACDDPTGNAGGARAYISLATGGDHTCAVSEEGAAYCWGRGLDGELGTGTKQNRATPSRVAGNVAFTQITAGDSHTCALANDGAAYCWGWNAFFERGNPTDPRDSEPVAVTTQLRFSSISAGAHHTCALATDSLAYCWGQNRYGQLGDSTTNTAPTPRRIATNLKFVEINSGSWHTCAVTAAGAIYCWGRNDLGQLGIGSASVFVTTPTATVISEPFAHVDGGAGHTCGVARSARLYCWGSSEFGELGDGSVFKPGLPGSTTPTLISSLLPAGVSISAGVSHTCAIGENGNARCWGRGIYGQLANGSFGDQYQPQPVHLQPAVQHTGDLFVITQLATGGATHACALADRSVFCWGTGTFGQLGVAGSIFAPLPQRVAD